jgi:hypothetical protein
MSSDNFILSRLKIKEVVDNKIKIDLDFNNHNHYEIIKRFDCVRREYFQGQSQHFHRILMPVRFKYDEYTGIQNCQNATLILNIKPGSQFLKNGGIFNTSNLKSGCWIESKVELTYTQTVNGIFILANIIYATIYDNDDDYDNSIY